MVTSAPFIVRPSSSNDPANLTLSSAEAAEATEILGARYAVPVHHDSWAHFTENADDLRAAFAAAGLSDRLVLLKPGEQARL